MKTPKRILILEDDGRYAELLASDLSEAWPDCTIDPVDNERDYSSALKKQAYDVILSDYVIPGFSGLTALALARRQCPGIPFLFVSGTIGDEVAVESLKAGATDYVLKDRIARLVPAIQRALNDVEESDQRRKIEEQLRQSEDQYRILFENATDLIQSVAPDGHFVYVNRSWRQTLGYKESEIATLSLFSVLHPSCHDQWRGRLKDARPNETYGPWETIFVTKSGRHLNVEGNLSGRFASGQLVATQEIFHDVTERKLAAVSLERSIRRYEALVNAVDGIVWQADQPYLRFTFVSQKAERLLGYPVRCWFEEPNFWQAHIHPEDRDRAIALCSELTVEQGCQSFEYRMLAVDGRVVWLRDMLSVRAEKDQVPQIQGIMVDITERKQAEDKVSSIQAQLEESNRDLMRKNQEIQNFYHTLSHELKTPLTSAREFIAIVMDRLAGPLNDTQSEYLGIAKESCDQLRLCINDLLDATRLETGKLALELKHTSLAALVQRVVTTMNSRAVENRIVLNQVVQPDLPDLNLDEHRITQVMINLLNNALKHTRAEGRITVEAGESPGQPEFVQVSVHDTGRGIPKEEQDRIFDRLYQVKAGDATTEQGIGLGLYLCRELVQLHGGNIWVESEPEKGSTFRFVLPKSQQLLRPNVMVIDDDSDVLDMVSGSLADEYNVRTAADGVEALKEIRRQVPDVVLLDLAMPNLDGLATLEQIRKNWDSVPIIVHTAYSGGNIIKQAMEFSPFTLLSKPCPVMQLRETVRRVLRSADTVIWERNHFGLQKPLLKPTTVPEE